jgi:hypothetical protein
MPKAPKKTISKTAFVRNLPSTMPALKVVEKAKEAGFVLTAQYVYKVRSLTKSAKARTKSASTTGAKKASGSRKVAASKGTKKSAAPAASHEAAFRKFVLQLGVQKSKALLNDVERKLRALVK